MTIREPMSSGQGVDTTRALMASLLTPGGYNALSARGGVVAGDGFRVHATSPASGALLVEAGTVWIPMGSTSGLNGATPWINDATLTFQYLSAFPPDTQARVDLIVARAMDSQASGEGSTQNLVTVITGVPGSSATPSIPTSWSAIPLYTCQLPANATSVTDAMLTRVFPYVAAVGAPIPVYSQTELYGLPIIAGQEAIRVDNGVKYRCDATSYHQIDNGYPADTFWPQTHAMPSDPSAVGFIGTSMFHYTRADFTITPDRDCEVYVKVAVEGGDVQAGVGAYGRGYLSMRRNGATIRNQNDWVAIGGLLSHRYAEYWSRKQRLQEGVPATFEIWVNSDNGNSPGWKFFFLNWEVDLA